MLFCLASSSAWAASLERLIMPGPLSTLHANLEESCSSCHDPLGETQQATLCVACHEEVGADVKAKTGFHGRLGDAANGECQSCHREHLGRDEDTLDFDWNGFDHTQTDFPLLWAHGVAECATCHASDAPKRFTPTSCVGCHREDDVHKGGLGNACDQCHTQRHWDEPKFDHAALGFKLEGGHANQSCSACHKNNQFQDTPTTCGACHAKQDVHSGAFGAQCQQCHTTNTFQLDQFDHLGVTGFALEFGHSARSCASCHTLEKPVLAGASCASCHQKDDVHKGTNGSQCAECHSTQSWSAHKFDHATTGFGLNGAHSSLACVDCHEDGIKAPVPTQCSGCHSPDPHAGQLGNDCVGCHNEVHWSKELTFHHDLVEFPLLGAHAALTCDSCHATLQFHDAATQCSACHAQDDVHQQTMGNQCESCHNPQTWQSVRFDHALVSGFELVGKHAQITCASCHNKPALLEIADESNCIGCHQRDEPHQGRFGQRCGTCHNVWSFDEIERRSP